jgi:hypothetical protein
VDAGLPPYTLGEDLNVGFSTCGPRVSEPVVKVQYLDPPTGVPEPTPGSLLLIAALSWASVKGLRRLSRRRVKLNIAAAPHGMAII